MVIIIACVGAWVSASVLVYTIKQSKDSTNKLKVMSVRRVLKQYKKLNDTDNKGIF